MPDAPRRPRAQGPAPAPGGVSGFRTESRPRRGLAGVRAPRPPRGTLPPGATVTAFQGGRANPVSSQPQTLPQRKQKCRLNDTEIARGTPSPAALRSCLKIVTTLRLSQNNRTEGDTVCGAVRKEGPRKHRVSFGDTGVRLGKRHAEGLPRRLHSPGRHRRDFV